MKKGILAATFISTFILLAGCGSTSTNDTTSQTKKSAHNTHGKVVKEIPTGDSIEKEGMDIAAVYFEPAEMYPPEKAGLQPNEADVHLEADIKATKNNKTGFGAGEWMPFLTVNYKIKNLDNGKESSGTFMPMNASDGPHYGSNIKMFGAGKYKLSLSIESPEKQNYLLHVDKGTGVDGQFWNKPVEVEWEFPYMPKK
ncbi:iron transporter [Neobacillus sp. PS3-40]|uniref:iron transporter n=1 Tax=Neobacillus sp. PS3-40 TaxID=3070679 RepID=UPI0027E18852|nr:iron transporter [Neobacillus sp. PS3-40]WML43786.1 iron transporter [Neobacillus sp. PS3-40]